MNVSRKAWRLVCETLFGPNDAAGHASLAAALRDGDAYWPQVVWITGVNLIAPALWPALESKRATSLIPADALDYSQAVWEMNRERNAALAAQLDDVIRVLNGGGIVPCLLKGAALLASGVYEDPASRMISDLDLLIPRGHLLAAQKDLATLGYQPVEKPELGPMHHHAPPLFRPGDYASIELHDEPVYRDAQCALDADELLRAARELGEPGARFRVPCPTHAVMLLFLHSEIVDRALQTWFVNLRALQDTAALQAKHGDSIDWQSIAERARRCGFDGPLANFLHVADRIAGLRPLSSRAGLGSRLTYLGCRAALRFGAVRAWRERAERYSSHIIRRSHGDDLSWAETNRVRFRMMTANLLRRFDSRVERDA